MVYFFSSDEEPLYKQISKVSPSCSLVPNFQFEPIGFLGHKSESNWSLNDDTLVCSLFDSNPDIIGEMAFLLDKQKSGLKDWADLAAKLGVARTTFTSFESCSTDNPTEQLFDILKVRFPKLTVGKLIGHLDAINRRDVIVAIKKSTKGLSNPFKHYLLIDYLIIIR